jgi:hypothetical protein
MDDVTYCPICGYEAKVLDPTGYSSGFDCSRHGRFKVSGSLMSSTNHFTQVQWAAALEKAKTEAKPGELPIITSYCF